MAVALREGLDLILDRAELLTSPALLSVVSVVELEGGVPAAPEGEAVRRLKLDELYETLHIIDFGQQEADAYRGIVDALGFSRSKIIDRMIAAQAIVAKATLATLNPRDFRGVPGLRVENWAN